MSNPVKMFRKSNSFSVKPTRSWASTSSLTSVHSDVGQWTLRSRPEPKVCMRLNSRASFLKIIHRMK